MRRLGKIRAAKKGTLIIRGEKHRQRPPARALRKHLLRDLINAVYVRAFFAIDFDVDETLVEELRGLFILETLVRKHVAPVTRGIAYA